MLSQHANCTVSLTVSSNTTSGEWKVKLVGIMLSDTANPSSEQCDEV